MTQDVVVDTHHHFLPSEAVKFAGKTEEIDYLFGLKRFSIAYAWMQDVEKTLRYMGDCGIRRVLVNQCSWSPNGLETCKAINNGYAKIQREYPGKFITCAHVPIHEGPSAVDELKRSIEELGLHGVAFLSSYTHIPIDSDVMMPFFEKIAQYDIPIVIHPTLRRPLWGGVKHDLSTTVSREYDLAKCVVEILYGVLPRFPHLKFLMSHFGGGMQSLKWRIMISHQPESWDLPQGLRGHALMHRELKERGLWDDFHRLFDQLYFDSAGYGGAPEMMRAAVDSIRRDRLTFGTDYPFEFRDPEETREYIATIRALAISDEDKGNILGRNVLNLFKMQN
jgi:predicted TIM-barrel fold metal-dependent hydrolase